MLDAQVVAMLGSLVRLDARMARGRAGRMTRITLICPSCGHKARRPLQDQAGARGVHETEPEPALCPLGHGAMEREDGIVVFLSHAHEPARIGGR
jgi:hypothetical protein